MPNYTIEKTESFTRWQVSFSSCADARYLLADLAKGINTGLLPTMFTDEKTFISESIAIQMSRSFSEGHFEAFLTIEVCGHGTELCYESTSGTTVRVAVLRDLDNIPKAWEVSVSLSSDRAKPKRCHYEVITKAMGWDGLNQPWWSEYEDYWRSIDLAAELEKRGWELVKTPLGSYWQLGDIAIHRDGDGIYISTGEGRFVYPLITIEELDSSVSQIKEKQVASLTTFEKYKEYEEDQEDQEEV